jgi:predicted Zn-dependent protease with MMP-like domain
MWRSMFALGSLLLGACSSMPWNKPTLPEGVIVIPAKKSADASKAGCPQKAPVVSWREQLWQQNIGADTSIWIDKECRCATASFSTWDSAQQVLGEEATRRIRNIIASDGKFSDLTSQDRQALKQFSESPLWIPASIEHQIGEAAFKQHYENIVTPKKDEVDNVIPMLKENVEELTQQYPEIPWDLQFAVVDGLSSPATALPGGYVVIRRAFLVEAKDKDKQKRDMVAFVLSHEIAHIARRHETKALQVKVVATEQGYELFRTVAKGLEKGSSQSATELVDSGTKLKQNIAFLAKIGLDYDKNLELEADSCAGPAAKKAQFNPVKGWDDYKTTHPSSGTEQNSHPPTNERDANLKRVFSAMSQ